MEYYDRYFRYYKEIMEPVLEWKKELEVKDNRRLWWCLWRGVLLIGAEFIGMILGNKFLGKTDNIRYAIITIVSVVIMLLTIEWWGKWLGEKVDEYKQKVAIKHGKENFIQLEEAREREFKEKLNDEKINTKEQYRILINAIDQQIKAYKPKKIFNYGALGALVLPLWNTLVRKLFEIEKISLAVGISVGIIITIICIVGIGIKMKKDIDEMYIFIHSKSINWRG